MIKLLRPIDIREGDLIYCGYTGKKVWRKVLAHDVVSVYRYNISLNGWHISAGSGCKYLVKTSRAKCDF